MIKKIKKHYDYMKINLLKEYIISRSVKCKLSNLRIDFIEIGKAYEFKKFKLYKL